MGFLMSKVVDWWGGGNPQDYDTPQGPSGLTPRQRDIVRKIWALVTKDLKGNGVDLFLKLFERYPEYQLMFRSFANVPLQDLRSNARLLGHATSVMYAFSSALDNLNDPDCLTSLLAKVGESHRPRKLSREHFTNLADILLEFLMEKLGPKVMDSFAIEAWRKTLDSMNSLIVASLEGEGTL